MPLSNTGSERVEIHMLPLDAGDSTLIVERNEKGNPTGCILVDAGLDKGTLAEYLKREDICWLDLVILSHPDADHVTGLMKVLEEENVDITEIWTFDLAFLRRYVLKNQVVMPADPDHEVIYAYHLVSGIQALDTILTTATGKSIRIRQVCEGTKHTVGRNLEVEVLYPPKAMYRALSSPRLLKQLAKRCLKVRWAGASERRAPHLPCEPATADERDQMEKLQQELRGRASHALHQDSHVALSQPSDRPEAEEDGGRGSSDTLSLGQIRELYNNLSIVAKASVANCVRKPAMLFPGDLVDWSYLAARRFDDLKTDVLKYPHHGSKDVRVTRSRLGTGTAPDAYAQHVISTLRGCCRGSSLLSVATQPVHTLLFPYVVQGLPHTASLTANMGRLHTNRQRGGFRGMVQSPKANKPRRVLLYAEPGHGRYYFVRARQR